MKKDNFFKKVVKTDTCWLWTGALRGGYGIVNYNKKTLGAHTLSLIFVDRLVPKNMVVDHICRVRNCVNPWHLRVVTSKENILCGTGASARNKRKTHCINGHELIIENLILLRWKKYGRRECRICNAAHKRRIYREKKQTNRDERTA